MKREESFCYLDLGVTQDQGQKCQLCLHEPLQSLSSYNHLNGNMTIREVFEVEEFNADNKNCLKKLLRGHF